MNRSTSSNQLLLILVAMVVAGAVGYFIGTQQSSSGGVPAGVPQADVGGGQLNDVKSTATAALDAFIKGGTDAYKKYVRPDYRGSLHREDYSLSGCDVKGSQVLVEQNSPSEADVTIIFKKPCGRDSLEERTAAALGQTTQVEQCRITTVLLSGNWYIGDTYENPSLPHCD
ncbi:MAG TPA: hypothetical protein VJB57_11810 [Dehalococcoidia bacterium]|nr:hypothetical protein [Dehalococcoidia bacterium]